MHCVPTVMIASRGVRRGCRGSHGCQLLRDRGELLLQCGKALIGGLGGGIVGQVEVGELVVECLFDVVERIIGFNNVGGAMISCMSGRCGPGDEAKVVHGGKVCFECVPHFVDESCVFPLHECYAV